MTAIPSQQTVSVGQKVKASLWNDDVRDLANFLLNPPSVRSYQAFVTTTMGTSGTTYVIGLDWEEWDTCSMHAEGTVSKHYAVYPGKYHVLAQTSFAADADGQRYVYIRKNANGSATGGTLIQAVSCDAVGSGSTSLMAQVEVSLAENDYLEMFAMHTAGNSLATNAGISATFFSMTWRGA